MRAANALKRPKRIEFYRILQKTGDPLYLEDESAGSRGATMGKGDTLSWTPAFRPETDVELVHAQGDFDLPKFTNMLIALMKAPPPKSKYRERNRRSLHYAPPDFL